MDFHKQRNRRPNITRAKNMQHVVRGDDSFDRFEQMVEENESSKLGRRDRRLNKRRYKRDPYSE